MRRLVNCRRNYQPMQLYNSGGPIPANSLSTGNQWSELGKVTLKSNGDEALSDESPLKSSGAEAFNDDFP